MTRTSLLFLEKQSSAFGTEKTAAIQWGWLLTEESCAYLTYWKVNYSSINYVLLFSRFPKTGGGLQKSGWQLSCTGQLLRPWHEATWKAKTLQHWALLPWVSKRNENYFLQAQKEKHWMFTSGNIFILCD